MTEIEKLVARIIDRVNVNLRKPSFDVGPYIRDLIPIEKFLRFYAFYGLTSHHPLHFHFHHSNLAGSYFLGKCHVDHSVVYKSDIRGDELKEAGDTLFYGDLQIPLHDDEIILIKDSFLIKNLVHSNSPDPESPEEFFIKNTASMHYANIHGAPVEGSYIGPFATIDLTTVHDSAIGAYSYVQAGTLSHRFIDDGQIFIRGEDEFSFNYRYNLDVLSRYIRAIPGDEPSGVFMEFVADKEKYFEKTFTVVQQVSPIPVPKGATLSRYAVVRGETRIGENVLVAQRAYLEDAWLGKGSNAQENCYIIASRLEGNCVTAHGGKIIHARLGEKVFVGFNSFLRGKNDCELVIGSGCIVMPHTIIDLDEPVEIPPEHLIWGYIRNTDDLSKQTISLAELSACNDEIHRGNMIFQGAGASFVQAFQNRIEHILEANGAYSDGGEIQGHAQKGRHISFNIIQPYQEGDNLGIYPTIDIRP